MPDKNLPSTKIKQTIIGEIIRKFPELTHLDIKFGTLVAGKELYYPVIVHLDKGKEFIVKFVPQQVIMHDDLSD